MSTGRCDLRRCCRPTLFLEQHIIIVVYYDDDVIVIIIMNMNEL